MNHSTCRLRLAALLLAASALAGNVSAIEVAPRISDREIVERLTRLEEGQQAMEEKFEQRLSSMEEKFEQRFSSMEERFEQGFFSLGKRMDAQWNLTLILIAAIFGLIGFVVWDRKTAFKPLEERLEKRLEQVAGDVKRELESDSPNGSRLTRLIGMFRELSRKDPRLAEALRRAFPPEGANHEAYGGAAHS